MAELRFVRRSRTPIGALVCAALAVSGVGLGATAASATGEGEPQQGGTLIVAGNPDVTGWTRPRRTAPPTTSSSG